MCKILRSTVDNKFVQVSVDTQTYIESWSFLSQDIFLSRPRKIRQTFSTSKRTYENHCTRIFVLIPFGIFFAIVFFCRPIETTFCPGELPGYHSSFRSIEAHIGSKFLNDLLALEERNNIVFIAYRQVRASISALENSMGM